jgi:hypothetical protein
MAMPIAAASEEGNGLPALRTRLLHTLSRFMEGKEESALEPEPSRALLLLLGAAGVVARRRW